MASASRIEDFADDFDPFTALLTIGGEGHITRPLEDLALLRRKAPVVEGDLHEQLGAPRQLTLGNLTKSYMVLGFNVCNEVLGNHQDYSNAIYQLSVGTPSVNPSRPWMLRTIRNTGACCSQPLRRR
jgi:hypothetical protein